MKNERYDKAVAAHNAAIEAEIAANRAWDRQPWDMKLKAAYEEAVQRRKDLTPLSGSAQHIES